MSEKPVEYHLIDLTNGLSHGGFASAVVSGLSYQVRGFASTTCEGGGVTGLRAAEVSGLCFCVAGACAIGSLLSGMYLRLPLSARNWLTQSSG